MKEKESVRLYQCHKCCSPIYRDMIEAGEGCGYCGSRQVTNAPATKRNIIRYFFHFPSEFVKYLKENVLGSDPIWVSKK